MCTWGNGDNKFGFIKLKVHFTVYFNNYQTFVYMGYEGFHAIHERMPLSNHAWDLKKNNINQPLICIYYADMN